MRAELQRPNIYGTPLASPLLPFSRLPQGRGFAWRLITTPSSRRLPKEVSPTTLAERVYDEFLS